MSSLDQAAHISPKRSVTTSPGMTILVAGQLSGTVAQQRKLESQFGGEGTENGQLIGADRQNHRLSLVESSDGPIELNQL